MKELTDIEKLFLNVNEMPAEQAPNFVSLSVDTKDQKNGLWDAVSAKEQEQNFVSLSVDAEDQKDGLWDAVSAKEQEHNLVSLSVDAEDQKDGLWDEVWAKEEKVATPGNLHSNQSTLDGHQLSDSSVIFAIHGHDYTYHTISNQNNTILFDNRMEITDSQQLKFKASDDILGTEDAPNIKIERVDKHCLLCEKKFQTRTSLEDYVQQIQSGSAKCAQCFEEFKNISDGGVVVQRNVGRKMIFSCPICHFKYPAQSWLNWHIQNHNTLHYKCTKDNCGWMFQTNMNLNGHVRLH